MANKFVSGFVVGALATVGALGGAVLAFKKTVIEPEEDFNNKVEENRRKANRKQHAAHQA
ncbi:hypothetical protein FC83_GL000852 [Agrilactobacillus composti DSM 18527 = JCM 14202]|uniref:DUF3042 domain-containing protein n=1 Tax=Agrilactobacillus composti DSM 18527 = JCM 14202 TaxID=1423734 RepID=X0QM58_9LACO|nr:DUF3042 family protein [Agrilactobacillus composti]KRM35825.1 hypothetical protein FC83_GL000852 [Agrilactobacillus composti DSM 18527 = JCM 14202]GAF39700.1 hypothetical protein JCM14202_1571 [Agrilactobacillus composti DSM 18527 = JCM 14202]